MPSLVPYLSSSSLPTDGLLVGRVWSPAAGGPCVVRRDAGSLIDITARFPTMRDLCEAADPAAAARAAAPLFGPGTLAISLLNGIDGPEKLAGGLRGSSVLGGSAYVSAVIAEPGLVRYTSGMSSIVFGAPQGDDAARAKAADFVERCRKAGFSAETTDDIQSSLWSKFIGLAANAALTSAARLPAGPLYSDPDVIEAAAALIAEGTAVARAAGVRVPADIEAVSVQRLKQFPPGMYASMYHDIAKGGPLEVDGLSGYIVREGRRLGVPTPHHAALYAVLKPHRAGTPKVG